VACLSASQNRLFPLGTFDNEVAFLEIRLERSERIKNKVEMIPIWRATTFITTYSESREITGRILFEKTNFFENDSISIYLRHFYNRAIDIASDIYSLKSLKLQDKTTFNIFERPDKINFKKGPEGEKIFFIEGKTKTQITELKEGEIGEKFSHKEYLNSFSKFYVFSKTTFTSDHFSFRIYNIGYGNTFGRNADDFAETTRETMPKTIDKLLKLETVLHHGDSFDFIIFD